METVNPGSSKYQFAINGLLLMSTAVRYPAGMVGTAEVAWSGRSPPSGHQAPTAAGHPHRGLRAPALRHPFSGRPRPGRGGRA